MAIIQELQQEPINEALLPDGWTLENFQSVASSIAQRVLKGLPFKRRLPVHHLGSGDPILHVRRVGIVAGRDALNDDVFIAVSEAPIVPSDFPAVPLAEAGTLFDLAEEGPRSLQTVRKDGASTVFVDTDAAIEKRGGDPNHHIEKPEKSFAYKRG